MNTIEVIADPMRRQILRLIWRDECSVTELVEQFQVTQPAISFHLRTMRDSGHVLARSEGRQRFYVANQDAFGEMKNYLESYWKNKLSLLKDEAEIEARRRKRG